MVRASRAPTNEKKHIDLVLDSFYLCVATVEIFSLKFAVKMMQIEPAIINDSAGRSYLQMKISLRKMMASMTFITMAVALLNESSTMSANGVTTVKTQKYVIRKSFIHRRQEFMACPTYLHVRNQQRSKS